MRKLKNYFRALTVLYAIWIIFAGKGNHFYMVWNIILAWVPLEISSLLYNLKKGHKAYNGLKAITAVLWVLWMLFYPNAPYIITDFIHISSSKFYIPNPNYVRYGTEPYTLFNDDFKIWIGFVSIGIGVWIGYMLGVVSLYMNQNLIREKFGEIKSWLFVVFVSLLSGFAIYLGRFIRWNSWDVILNPYNFISIIINDFHMKAINFTILFGLFNLILYSINYAVIKLVKEK